jgi:outer membrane protein assembly factor BamE
MVMRHTIILLALLMCAACSSYSLKPYKMDIQQGNVVTSKMMLQLRPGMNKSQVRFIMGTPLIQDSFHRDRWDYFYQMRKAGKIIEQRRVILEFEGDALKRVRGDVIPAGTGDVAEPSPVTSSGSKATTKPEEKKGLMDKLKFWKSDDEDQQKPQAAPGELIAPAAAPAEQAPAPSKGEPQPAAAPASAPAVMPADPALVAPEETQAPAAAPQQKQVAPQQEQVKPAPAEPAKAPAPETVQEAAPAKTEPANAAPVAQPAAKPTTTPEAKPEAKAEPKQPATKPAKKPAPVEEDLPPEDEPGYFERMLEKIGF